MEKRSHVNTMEDQLETIGDGKLCSAELLDPMNVLCWNIQGMKNPRMVQALRKVLRKHSQNLVFLSKTRLFGT